ncbi:unnamed protein product [Didymodactylos carnosus]|uniref:Sodium/bile acid cotransporter n=1 Tax=Didymodactylos carnosus TaxID=1234261 RepID=A0A813ZDC5_9BILA|nr:unnamed protein product [Didymodactylos carnosus]CAF3679679.1 unnamed protein product [Didymodactylos carnosus]
MYPNIGRTNGILHSEWSITPPCIILVFFLSGLLLETKLFVHEIIRIRLHLLVQIYSLSFMPAIVYGLALLYLRTMEHLYSFNKTLIASIVITSSLCTTISGNVIMTKQADGNEYSALGNILGVFISPAIVTLFMKNPLISLLIATEYNVTPNNHTNNLNHTLDYKKTLINLGYTVILPLVVGQIFQLIWSARIKALANKLQFPKLSSVLLLLILWCVFCNAFANKSFKLISKTDLIVLLIIQVLIYISFSLFIMIIARLPLINTLYSE